MAKRMSYLVHRLKEGLTTKLHAYGLAIGTAVWMSSNIRRQFSGVTQTATIMQLKDQAKHRESFGIEIVLSVDPERQVAERKKSVARTFNKARRSSPNSQDLSTVKPSKSAQTAETSALTVGVEVGQATKVKDADVADEATATPEKEDDQENNSINSRSRAQKSATGPE